MKPLNIKEKHRERLNVLIKHIEQKLSANETISLKRKEICEIIGISEGDSAKVIFRILDEVPEEYSDRITYAKDNRTYIFGIAENNVFSVAAQHSIVTFNNVITLNGKTICLMSGLELKTLWMNQDITYNPALQRGKKIVIRNGEELEEDVCSQKNIDEIAELMATGKYVTDTIILNIMNCNIEYTNNQMIVEKTSKKSEINVLDGQHRFKGNLKHDEMIANNESNYRLEDYIFPVQIENMPLEKAQAAFSQFTKGLKISTTRKEYLDNYSPYTAFLKEVFNEESIYSGKIEIVKDTIKKSDKWVSFGTLASAVKQEFKEDELTVELQQYFKRFFNLLGERLSSVKDEDSGMLKENITYYGYIALCKKLVQEGVCLESDFDNIFNKIYNLAKDKTSRVWVGKVLLKGRNGMNITNKKDTRLYVASKFKEIAV